MTIQGNSSQKLTIQPTVKTDLKPVKDAAKHEGLPAEALQSQELDGLQIGTPSERDEATQVIKCFPHELNLPDLGEWQEALHDMDGNHDGKISEEEFISDYVSKHPPQMFGFRCGTADFENAVATARMIFRNADRNGDGAITFFESNNLPKEPNVQIRPGGLLPSVDFKAADSDHDGKVSRDEFKSAMAKAMGPYIPIGMYLKDGKPYGVLDAAFDRLDGDHDGSITVQEAQDFDHHVGIIFKSMVDEAK